MEPAEALQTIHATRSKVDQAMPHQWRTEVVVNAGLSAAFLSVAVPSLMHAPESARPWALAGLFGFLAASIGYLVHRVAHRRQLGHVFVPSSRMSARMKLFMTWFALAEIAIMAFVYFEVSATWFMVAVVISAWIQTGVKAWAYKR